MVEAVKDPAKVRAGVAGSRARWGERRIVRLDSLDPAVAAVIRALVAAEASARNEKGSAVSETPAEPGAHGVGRERDAA